MKMKYFRVWAIVNVPFMIGYWIISSLAPNLAWYVLFGFPWFGIHIWVGNQIDWEYFREDT